MSLNYIHKKKVVGTSNFTHLDISMVNSKYQDIKVQLYYVGSAFMDINSLHMLTCNIHEHRKCNCEK